MKQNKIYNENCLITMVNLVAECVKDFYKKIISSFLILLILLTSLTGCYTYNINKVVELREEATSDTIYIPKKALRIRLNDEKPHSKYYILQKSIGFNAIYQYVTEYELSKKYPVEFITNIGGGNLIHYQFNSCDTCKTAMVIKTYLADQMIEIETETVEFSVGKTVLLGLAIFYGVVVIPIIIHINTTPMDIKLF